MAVIWLINLLMYRCGEQDPKSYNQHYNAEYQHYGINDAPLKLTADPGEKEDHGKNHVEQHVPVGDVVRLVALRHLLFGERFELPRLGRLWPGILITKGDSGAEGLFSGSVTCQASTATRNPAGNCS